VPVTQRHEPSRGWRFVTRISPAKADGARETAEEVTHSMFTKSMLMRMHPSQLPNNQFQRSGNSRLRRLSPPAELGRSAAPGLFDVNGTAT